MSKAYFNEVANAWDTMRSSFFPDSIREKAFRLANLKENSTVIDLGCGTGYITEGLMDKPLSIIAIDQSPKMLETMKDKFQAHSNIKYAQGNAENLPIDSDSVDYIFANMYLHHIIEPIKAIKEAFRVLKKSGKLIITDLDEHKHEFLKTEQHDHWMGFNRQAIVNWYEEAGFKNVSVNCTEESCKSDSNSTTDIADISVFIAYGEK